MKAVGIVKKINNSITEIEVYGDEAGCASCSGGSCASCASAGKTRTYKAINNLNLDLKTGIPVEIELPAGKAAAAFIRVIVLPLLLLFLFYFFIPAPGGKEVYRVISGFGGLLAGFGLNFLIPSKIKVREMPVITKILFEGR